MRAVRQRGSALFYTLIMIIIVTTVSMTALGYARSTTQVSSNQVTRARLRGLAECAMGEAIHNAWDKYQQYLKINNVTTSTAGRYGTWADTVGWSVGSPHVLYGTAGTVLPAGTILPSAPFTVPAGAPQNAITTKLGFKSGSSAGTTTGGGLIGTATVTLARSDIGTSPNQSGVVLTITVVAQDNNYPTPDRVTLVETFKVGAAPWPGLRFALLTNQVNCIFCHATFDNAARVFNKNPALYNTFEPVRIAAIQHMGIPTTMNLGSSTVNGTLYSASGIYSDMTGQSVPTGTAGSPSLSSAGMLSFGAITNTGFISQNTSTGNVNGAPAPSDADLGSPVQANQNLYLNYPTNGSQQADGAVPGTFPAVVTDTNNNKIVDDSEWATTVQNTATGTLSGYATVVAYGSTTATTSMPTSGSQNFGGVSAGLGTSTESNVILYGTLANPININGTVAFGGDVVIGGYIQGTGEILARGNMYVVQDMKYVDGTSAGSSDNFWANGGNRTFGVQPTSGANPAGGTYNGSQNAVSYAAGGNIMMGDWFTNQNGANYNSKVVTNPVVNGTTFPGTFNMAADDYSAQQGGTEKQLSFDENATFNRAEWAKTQQYLPVVVPTGVSGTFNGATGYNALPAPVIGTGGNVMGDTTNPTPPTTIPTQNHNLVIPGGATPSTAIPVYTSGASNAVWAVNPNYIPNYTPRFYTESDGNVYIAADLPPAQAGANPAQAGAYTNAGGANDLHQNQAPQAAGTQGMTGFTYVPSTNSWAIWNNNTSNQAECPQPGQCSILSSAYLGAGAATNHLDPVNPAPFAPAVVTISPNNSPGTTTQWISETTLNNLTQNALSNRTHPTNSGPFEIDGMVYTNNAIFCIARSGSNAGGQITVNGALLAADTGLLAPSGLSVNYDANTRNYINVSDPNHVALMNGQITEK